MFCTSTTLPDASLSKAGSYISVCKHSASEWSEAVPLTQSRPPAGFDLHFKTMVTFYHTWSFYLVIGQEQYVLESLQQVVGEEFIWSKTNLNVCTCLHMNQLHHQWKTIRSSFYHLLFKNKYTTGRIHGLE